MQPDGTVVERETGEHRRSLLGPELAEGTHRCDPGGLMFVVLGNTCEERGLVPVLDRSEQIDEPGTGGPVLGQVEDVRGEASDAGRWRQLASATRSCWRMR